MQFGELRLDHCRYGWMLHKGPSIGKCLELYGEYGEAEVQVLRAFLHPGDVCVDVGADIGALTLPMSRMVGPQGRILAFASHAGTFQVLNANLALNGVTNVRTVNAFVAEAADVDMGGPRGAFGFIGGTWRPPVMPLDALALERCKLLKVDADGKEYEVLHSAEATIRRCSPALSFENDERMKSARLLDYVMRLGYAAYFHPAPIFRPDNFRGNPVNNWAPTNMISSMMLALPLAALGAMPVPLRRVQAPEDWWVA